MSHPVRTLQLGEATITVLNAGDIEEAFTIVVPEDDRDPELEEALGRPLRLPFQAIHVALLGASILVDAFDFGAITSLMGFRPPAGDTPLPDLPTQLRAAGIAPDAVTHLIVTHAHFDHYSGVTGERDGRHEPTYPNARCYAGRADWDTPAGRELRAGDAAVTMGELFRRDLVTLVEGDSDLVPGVRLIAAPGESPGHLIVRVHSASRTLYCLGDLFHYPVEAAHPRWMMEWGDAAPMLASRRALIAAALDEGALLVAAHIPGVGRLRRAGAGAAWEPAP
jgi:glyoxylase-like metal-dependent hydrolase (beta-lactamase superfamily II)